MKTTKEMIEVMQAYEDGKKIEYFCNSGWCDADAPSWNWGTFDYRVKVKLAYRPYTDSSEMIDDFCKRFGVKKTSYGIPFIWVIHKETKESSVITRFGKSLFDCPEGYIGTSSKIIGMEELFSSYTYLDGSPCGVKE